MKVILDLTWLAIQFVLLILTASVLELLTRSFIPKIKGYCPRWLFGTTFIIAAIILEIVVRSYLGSGFGEWILAGLSIGALYFILNKVMVIKRANMH